MGKRTGVAVWIEKYQRWQYKAQKDGVRKTFYSSTPGRKGQRECHEKVDAWLDEGIDCTNKKVSDMFDAFIEDLKLTTSRSHWEQYEGYGRLWIKPTIGTVRISKLNDGHLQDVINKAYAGKLSKKTLQNISGCLKAFVKYARKHRATTFVPEDLKIPRSAPVGERVILQPDDLKTLFMVEETTYNNKRVRDIYINAYRLAVLTGLRPGELLGLKWEDIKGDVIHVRRSRNRFGEETTGKNENAKRSVKLNNLSRGVIDDQRLHLILQGIDSEFVFPNMYGEQSTQKQYYMAWTRYRDRNGIQNKASPYELRHTFVSMAKCLPEGMLKMIVGHSKDMDTYGVYSHEVEGDMSEIAKQLENIFSRYLKSGL